MARGRKRKDGKREPNGRIKRVRQAAPERIEMTPQMKRHKAIASGGEVGNPLSYLPICQEYRHALGIFFDQASRAGWGVRVKTADLDPVRRGGDLDEEQAEARDLICKATYEEADAALLLAGKWAHRAVHELRCFRRASGDLSSLEAGAKALCDVYRIEIVEDAA